MNLPRIFRLFFQKARQIILTIYDVYVIIMCKNCDMMPLAFQPNADCFWNGMTRSQNVDQ